MAPMNTPWWRRPGALLLLLTLVAGLLRVLMAGWYLHLNQDATYLFLPCAHAVAQGDLKAGLDHTIPTGFLAVHVFWVWLGQLVAVDDGVFWARLFTAFTGTACVPLAYAMGRCFLSPKYALSAAAFVAFSAKSVEYSGRVSSEIPYAAALTLAAWLSLRAIRSSTRVMGETADGAEASSDAGPGRAFVLAALSGLSIGFAYLIRPEGMALLPATLLGLAWQWKRHREPSPFWRVPVVIVAFVIAALPMIWVNYQATGRVSLSNKGGISLERHERGPELALTDGNRITMLRYNLSREGYRPFSLLDQILDDPVGFTGRSAERAMIFIYKYLPRIMGVGSTLGIVLLLFGFLWRLPEFPWQGHLLLYVGGNVVIYLAALSLFFLSDRFVLPLVPLLAVLGAAGFALVFEGWARRRGAAHGWRRHLPLICLLGCVGIDVAMSSAKLDKYDGWSLGWRADPLARLANEVAARYPAERVLSPGGEIAYHMGAIAVIFPNDRYDNFIEYCAHQEVDYVVYRADSEGRQELDTIHQFIAEWPLQPAGLQECEMVTVETPLGPVSARVWRVER